MRGLPTLVPVLMAWAAISGDASGADEALAQLDGRFASTIQPFLRTYCVTCHGKVKPEAEFDLSAYDSMAAVVKESRRWGLLLQRLKAEEMPPPDAESRPSAEARRQAIDWFQALRDDQTRRNAGDPGVVPARRLSNAEYNYTIRDLTGVDVRPTREFPVDPSNTAGFDNSGESLVMSPALLGKYLKAAHEVASHMFLKTSGFAFAPHPMLADTDRDKYCVQRIIGFYHRQAIDYADYSNAYGSHISWQSADSPVPNEIYPSLAFDSLFENRGSLRNISVLDRVRDRALKLSRKVSSTDRAKLDEYLTSVREVEKNIERMRADKSRAEDRAGSQGRPLFTMNRPENGLPEDFRDHTRLMCDIIALAFQTDKTRIASLLLARDLSSLYYPFLDVRDAHHGASHNDTSDGYERVARFHLGQLAYLAQRLDAMPEGPGTVLDHCCLMFLSNMWSGTKHDNKKVPVVTGGGLGGTLRTGRSLDYLHAGDGNRKLCSLYLGLMDRMGVRLDHFGDADTRLEGF